MKAELADRSVGVSHALLAYFLEEPSWTAEVNTFAAMLCFRRAIEQCTAGLFLVGTGLLSEVPLVLRGAYESAGLGRKLVREPDAAERWLNDGTWHPDREVRAWLRESGGDDFAETYRAHYRNMSDMAHTTLYSCRPFVDAGEEDDAPTITPMFVAARQIDGEGYLTAVAATGLFVFFCMRNAAVDERVIPEELRQEAQSLMEAITGEPADHLDRDWDAERKWLDRFISAMPPAESLDERLADHPTAFDKLNPDRADDE